MLSTVSGNNTYSAQSTINDTLVATFNANYSNSALSYNMNIRNLSLYSENKITVDTDYSDFVTYVETQIDLTSE